MRNTVRVLKVKIKETSKGEDIFMEWETKSENGWERQTLKSTDVPRPELYSAMRVMGLHALKLCELKHTEDDMSEYWQAGEVNIKYNDDVRCRILVIKASVPVRYGYNFSFKTPAWAVPDDARNLQADVNTLADEAMRYISGDRAQGKLNLEGAANE